MEKYHQQEHLYDNYAAVNIVAKWEKDVLELGLARAVVYKLPNSHQHVLILDAPDNARLCAHCAQATFSFSENDQCVYYPL
jgi:hypothetical protein